MNTIKKLVLAAVVLPVAIGTASAYAFGGKDHHKGQQQGEFRMGFDRGIMHELDLTDAQKDQLKSLRKEGKSEMKAKFKGDFASKQAERQSLRQKMGTLLLADDFDTAKATDLVKEMSDMRASRQVEMLEKQHQMLSVLTPEQKTKFIELQQERAEKQAEKMQRRMTKHNN